MGLKRLASENIISTISESTHVLVSQTEQIDGRPKEVVRRIACDDLISDLKNEVVRFDTDQDLTSEQKAQARMNIGAASGADIQTAVESVTENNGVVTVTCKNGTSTTFNIPAGLAFDSGYCAVDETDGKTYLHLTMDGEDIEGFEPFEVSGGGMDFDGGFCAEDPEDGKYYLHLTKEGVELDGSIFTPIEIVGGGGGEGTTSTIVLSDVERVISVRNGADAIFSFTATSSDDTDITVVWFVGSTQVGSPTENYSGSTFRFNARGYLHDSGTSTVRAVLTSAGGGSLTRQWIVTSTAFSLSWGSSISPITLYTADENVYAVVDVAAQTGTTNNVTISVGQNSVTRSVTGSRSLTVELDKTWFEPGANTVTAGMVSGTDPTDRADDISFVALWGYGAATPIVAFAKSAQTGTQYDVTDIHYFAYDPGNESALCTIQVGSDTPRSVIANRSMQTFSYSYIEEMTDAITLTVNITCGAASDTMELTVNPSDYDIGMVTGDSLRYDLNPVGRTNSDADREQFGGLTFSEGFDWKNGGFQTDSDGAAAFVIKKGHRVTLPRSLFADNDANGKVIDVSFRIANSDEYGATAMQDTNNGFTKGLILKANEGELRLDNASGQVFYYGEERRVDLSIHVEDAVAQRLVTIWLDGIPSKVDAYEASSLVQDENNMVIGSEHCDVWIYAVHVYSTKLSNREMMQNYIAFGSTTTEKILRYQKNDIFDSNNRITPENLHRADPELTIVSISIPRMTVSKKDPVPADVTITDGTTVLELAKASAADAKDGTLIKVQGTSSSAYGRSSYNLDIDFKGTGETYKISDNSIPVNYINIKVNVASSENANNVNAVDWYNTFQPYLTIPRSRPGVRDTIEGKPCAVFITNTAETAVWFSSQLVQPGETILYAMGDLCNSKKNTAVFGQDGKGVHYTMGCVEVSGNDTQAQQFLATATYNVEDGEWQNTVGGEIKTEYEWRMEPSSADLDTVVDAWDAAVAWVVSTIGDSAKFKAEAGDHFAIDSLLYHFLFLEYFAAYDNVSKNTFYSYDWDETEQKYLWNIKAAYDWDTILASDNDGKPFGDYGIDYGDTTGGRHYFNASGNPIWINIQDAFQSELSAMYVSLRSAGAWDSAAIADKWDSYQDKRPHAAMMQDAFIKYVYPYKTTGVVIDGQTYGYDDSYLPRLNGSKTYQRQRFLKYQTYYMDGKYGYFPASGAMLFRSNSASGTTKNFVVKAYAKTYIAIRVDANKPSVQKIEAGQTATFSNVSVGNNATIYVSPQELIQYVRPLNETYNSTFSSSGAVKLMEAILGGETVNSAWTSGTGLTVPSPVLKELSIKNIENFSSALNLTSNVELKVLDTRGTNAGRITLPAYAPLTDVHLNACTGISALNLDEVTDFDLESGEDLTYVRIENCNSVVNDAILEYLEDMMDAGGTVTRNVRIILPDIESGYNWVLEDTSLLNWLLTAKGIDDSGITANIPCILSGKVYVPILRQGEQARYDEAWPDLDISYRGYINQHEVTFRNYDGTVLYTEYVDQGSDAADPVLAGYIATPAKTSTAEFDYIYRGWDTSLAQIDNPRTITAQYTAVRRSYTVRWYSKGVLMDEQSVQYGEEAVYSGNDPTYTAEEPMFGYYLWTGKWDQSTGYVTGAMNVNALFEYADLSVPVVSTEDMTAAYLYGLRQRGTSFVRNALQTKDRVLITLGYDPTYSNVQSWETDTELVFDGVDDYLDTGIALLANGISDGWTLAVDYEFTEETNGATLLSLWQDDGYMGFKLSYSTERQIGAALTWGNETYYVQQKMVRDIMVLRHIPGSNSVYCYTSRANKATIGLTVLNRIIDTQTSKTLVLGCGQSDVGGRVDFAAGIIHKCKIWYGDIGNSECQKIAAWPFEKICIETAGYNSYKRSDDAEAYSEVDFVSAGLLHTPRTMNATITNENGYAGSDLNQWLNTRVMNSFPMQWRSIMREVSIPYIKRVSDNAGEIYTLDTKIFIPSFNELTQRADEPWMYEGTLIPWMIGAKFRGLFVSDWARTGAQYFEQNTDPSLVDQNNVQDGDVWRNLAVEADYPGYVYLRRNGAWKRCVLYWTRTSMIDNETSFYLVNALGTLNGSVAYNGTVGINIRFSI